MIRDHDFMTSFYLNFSIFWRISYAKRFDSLCGALLGLPKCAVPFNEKLSTICENIFLVSSFGGDNTSNGEHKPELESSSRESCCLACSSKLWPLKNLSIYF